MQVAKVMQAGRHDHSRQTGNQPSIVLLPLALAQNSDGLTIETDNAGPAAFGGAFDALESPSTTS
jgi:hypothetical protein